MKKKYILRNLKDEIKAKNNIEVVLIGTNVGYKAIDEDAIFLEKEFNLKSYKQSENSPTTVTISFEFLNLYIRKFKEIEISYVFLSIVDENMTREITHSSDINLIGLTF